MRFAQVLSEALTEMRAKTAATDIVIVISIEKADELDAFGGGLSLKHRVKLDLPERLDRKLIMEPLLPPAFAARVDLLEVSKYLQGKTFRDIRQIVTKLARKEPSLYTSVGSTQSQMVSLLLKLNNPANVCE